MMDWEKTLDFLYKQGWGYGYAKCIDAETGSEVYLVNINRGEDELTSVKSTIDEAVKTLSRLVEELTGLKKRREELRGVELV